MAVKQRVWGVILAVLVIAILSGAFMYGYFYVKPGATSQTQGIQNPLKEIQDLENRAKANPQDISLSETLANRYFDLGQSLQDGGNAQAAKDYFSKAVDWYKKVLAVKPQVSIETDMATALYYSDQTDLAESAYKKAIEMDPSYINAHLNYGIFLYFVRNDADGARRELTAALNLKPQDGDAIQKINQLLAQIGPGTTTTTQAAPDYTNNIEPILFHQCTGCHGPGGSMAKSPLHTYAAVMKFVTPGNVNSPLLTKIKSGHPQRMQQQSINLIQKWIAGGAIGPKATP